MPTNQDPRSEYQERLARHRTAETLLTRRQKRLANARLAVFVIGLAAAWIASRGVAWLVPWTVVPVVGFVALVVIHGFAAKKAERASRAALIYERGLANLDDAWAGKGNPGTRFLDPHHPFSEDLDLFGVGSLFERLCVAETQPGQATLADWLLKPAELDVIRQRREAVRELAPRLDLREDVAILAANLDREVKPESVLDWAAAPLVPFPKGARPAAWILSVLGLGTAVGWLFVGTGFVPFLVVALVEMAFALWLRGRVEQAAAGVETQSGPLSVLAGVLARIEREPFECPALVRLRSGLETEGDTPSRLLGKLARLVDLLEARKNQMFMPVAWVLLWSTHLSMGIESWRRRHGASVRLWFEIVGEFEAISSLAAYTFENPDDCFPDLLETGPVFEGKRLGHPLQAKTKAVRNDVRLNDQTRVLIISGSNMSGKSTLLRTVGTNAVLALVGGPTRAESLRISRLALGATLRVRDSLQEGHSRFFAELVRLRQLVDLARGTPPLLFLLDEILHGTNSHDRRTGAEAVVKGLLDLGAVGLVTTHDLALAEVVEKLGSIAVNVHFADQFENGVMTFDYTMRPGVVRHSNALALMRAVGLDVG